MGSVSCDAGLPHLGLQSNVCNSQANRSNEVSKFQSNILDPTKSCLLWDPTWIPWISSEATSPNHRLGPRLHPLGSTSISRVTCLLWDLRIDPHERRTLSLFYHNLSHLRISTRAFAERYERAIR
ncbi:hypothetical protein MUK42_11021 [Musa troglodytarum]|uniref:Uncharacterized protein n=1 Tax=Musa troglodytarum TaxID=320322 RepID=A0A9E7L165_9LILI|nr:hypothetical protein MUK42_11021 [Musa troglodytarum]